MVPAEAVVDTGETHYLFVAKDGGHFEPRLVKVGARAEDHVEILSGVSEGETVVTTGNFLIDSESRLRAAIEGQTSGAGAPAGGAAAPASGCDADYDAGSSRTSTRRAAPARCSTAGWERWKRIARRRSRSRGSEARHHGRKNHRVLRAQPPGRPARRRLRADRGRWCRSRR